MRATAFLEQLQEERVVVGIQEKRPSRDRTLNDVLHDRGRKQAWQAGHGQFTTMMVEVADP